MKEQSVSLLYVDKTWHWTGQGTKRYRCLKKHLHKCTLGLVPCLQPTHAVWAGPRASLTTTEHVPQSSGESLTSWQCWLFSVQSVISSISPPHGLSLDVYPPHRSGPLSADMLEYRLGNGRRIWYVKKRLRPAVMLVILYR